MMCCLANTVVLRHLARLCAAALVAAGLPVLAAAQSVQAENIVEATTVVRDTAAAPERTLGDDEAPDDATDPDQPFEIPSVEHLTRLETQLEFVDLFEQQRFADALPLAESLVTLTESEFGRPSGELATALNNLAVIQRNLGRYEESKASYVDSIEMYREVEGPYTDSIIAPLVSLGANYHATGDYTQALGIFQEARTVNRRSFGLLNPDQVEIVYHIATTLSSMSRYEEAHRQHEDALRLMERVHGSDTLEFVPYIYRYAEWLTSAFQFEPARFQLVRAMDIIREIEGPDSLSLVRPLRQIGNSYRIQKLAEGRGISALRRALEIADSTAEPDPLVTARVLRDIGDWYTAFSRVSSTGEEYRQAWELLGDVDNGEQIRARWFSEPDYVLREYPSSRGLADADDIGAVEGFVRITFDVDEYGDPLNVMVLESEPAGFKDDTMLRAIRRSRFRPRVVDGEVVYSAGLIRNFTFYYEPEE
jgi:TonB family protein